MSRTEVAIMVPPETARPTGPTLPRQRAIACVEGPGGAEVEAEELRRQIDDLAVVADVAGRGGGAVRADDEVLPVAIHAAGAEVGDDARVHQAAEGAVLVAEANLAEGGRGEEGVHLADA